MQLSKFIGSEPLFKYSHLDVSQFLGTAKRPAANSYKGRPAGCKSWQTIPYETFGDLVHTKRLFVVQTFDHSIQLIHREEG